MSPSDSPSLDPCKGYDGVFGDTSDDDAGFVVSYSYGVERNKAVEEAAGATLSDTIADLESSTLNMLVGSFYSGCNSDPESRSLLDRQKRRNGRFYNTRGLITKNLDPPTSDNVESHLLGLKSSPVDLANGRKF